MRLRIGRARRALTLGVVVAALGAGAAVAAGLVDFGEQRDSQLRSQASSLFGGIGNPLTESAPTVANAAGVNSVALASGLRVGDVLRGDINGPATAKLAQNADMIAFWPSDDNPAWGIVCIESGTTSPGVQRIRLRGRNKGTVETILTGTNGCDGIRRTPWGTILATEERADGWALEIYKPLQTTGASFDRATGAVTDTSGADESANVVTRPALGRFAWEGIAVFEDGSLYAGDELGPSGRRNGGTMFKYVPQTPVDELPQSTRDRLQNPRFAASSPFAAGSLYALEIGARTGNNGQGNQLGEGAWQGPIDPGAARTEGQARGTGFYRPEDIDIDPIAAAEGRRSFCWTNTGASDIGSFGEVLCLDDVAGSGNTGRRAMVTQFVTGNPKMNQPDNIAFQPTTGIVYVIEDTPTVDGQSKPGDIWACLRDGADDDLQSDGCVRVLSVKTAGSEPTGFVFDGSGERAYLDIQHSPDNPGTPVNEAQYDEMLVIEGFEPDEATAAR